MRTIFLATLLPLAACGAIDDDDGGPGIAGAGSGSERRYDVRDFTKVELRGADDIDLRVGSGFSVRAEGDAAVLDKLKVERVGDRLRVGRTGMSWGGGKAAKIYVTLPRLTQADLTGAGDMAIDRVEGARFRATIAGSGDLTVGSAAVQDMALTIAGSGNLIAAGTTQMLDASIAGSGNIAADRLTATRANVSIAGTGDVSAVVDGPAKVSIMGVGNVDLGPKARCETTKMGTGTVRCG